MIAFSTINSLQLRLQLSLANNLNKQPVLSNFGLTNLPTDSLGNCYNGVAAKRSKLQWNSCVKPQHRRWFQGIILFSSDEVRGACKFNWRVWDVILVAILSTLLQIILGKKISLTLMGINYSQIVSCGVWFLKCKANN